MNYCELIMVDGDDNHNKVYIMTQINESQFKAEWGRYGSPLQSKLYSMSVWDSLKKQKINKGYTDVTKMKSVVTNEISNYSHISDTVVAELVDRILRYANECIKKNYSIKKQDVTAEMLRTARKYIEMLNKCVTENKSVDEFNKYLNKLFCIMPRKMRDVKDFLAKSDKDYAEIIERENDLINIMSSMTGDVEENAENDGKKTILETFGLEIRPCDEKENLKIKEKLTAESAEKFSCAFRISNKKCDERFNKYVKEHHISKRDVHFYWHGTRNQNVWGILKKGMLLNPNAPITGKMFGYGLYFAPRAKKSIGYTSLDGSYWAKGRSDEGYMFVMKVAYKKPLMVFNHEHRFCGFRNQDIKNAGCDALFASKDAGMLRNDEVIVYDEAQVCPRYLIILK